MRFSQSGIQSKQYRLRADEFKYSSLYFIYFYYPYGLLSEIKYYYYYIIKLTQNANRF